LVNVPTSTTIALLISLAGMTAEPTSWPLTIAQQTAPRTMAIRHNIFESGFYCVEAMSTACACDDGKLETQGKMTYGIATNSSVVIYTWFKLL
jgi:hypothetical protein